MTIDSVHYSRKMSDGNYGNLELGMHAQVAEGEDPSTVAADLRAYVDHLLSAGNKAHARWEDLERDMQDMERAMVQKGRDLERMQAQWEQARAFLEHHGLDVSRYGDTPF